MNNQHVLTDHFHVGAYNGMKEQTTLQANAGADKALGTPTQGLTTLQADAGADQALGILAGADYAPKGK